MGKELDPAKGGGGAMDVDGGDAKKGTGAADATVPATPPGPPSVPAVLTAAASLMDRAAKTKDVRGLPNRALRLAAGARSRFDGPGLTAFLDATFPAGDEARGVLAGAVAQAAADAPASAANGAAAVATTAAPPTPPPTASPLPEVELFATLVVVMFAIDARRNDLASTLASAGADRARSLNRRTLDVLAARLVFYWTLAAERAGAGPAGGSLLRPALLAAHRAACLRHDEAGQEVLLNALLRSYLGAGLVGSADALRAKAQRPDPPRSTAQAARTAFYSGRLAAARLQYSDARDALLAASRKAPTAAVGFRATCAQWLTVVRLLLGEVPPLRELAADARAGPGADAALGPYLALARAVRSGDLGAFGAVTAAHASAFTAHGTAPLVGRLRHAVIRAGLSRLAAAYARLPLAVVAARLGLASAEDAAAVAAKAIADGALDATLDRDGGWMACSATGGGGAGGGEEGGVGGGGGGGAGTDAGPRAAFHARTAFCLDIHNEAVRALRFEPNAHKPRQRETDEQARERARAEEEMARTIAEGGGDEDEEDDMGDEFM